MTTAKKAQEAPKLDRAIATVSTCPGFHFIGWPEDVAVIARLEDRVAELEKSIKKLVNEVDFAAGSYRDDPIPTDLENAADEARALLEKKE